MDHSLTAFRNRLRKMDRHHGKWARRKGLKAYRVYDADLDEAPLTVDRYGERVYVARYDEEGEADYREIIAETLGVAQAAIYLRERRRQQGKRQYEKLATAGNEFVVSEYGRRFRVNLTDYLDTGLFLDHRELRRRVGDLAKGLDVLNLFAYTCSFGVYAATGGARRVDNVDLSNTYLDWGRRNFRENGLNPDDHGFIRADILQWLDGPVTDRYDLIVLDPPTFSNSKMMTDVLDTQRDHVRLIQRCLDRLRPGGTLFFSTNYRKFKLDEASLPVEAREITAQTLSPDFRRKNLHRSWTFVI